MNITYEKATDKNLDAVIESLEAYLKEHGYGVLWHLDFKEKLENKGLDFENDYRVLEVCDPKQAHELMGHDIQAGFVLPCKMVVRRENGKTHIGYTSPKVLLGFFKNPDIDAIADRIEDTLKDAIEAVL
ncbi:MAG: DUF302 domain-containing protein [Candidatus Izemoplasmataceae bacterium]